MNRMSGSEARNRLKGKLIAAEGIDGSGKSIQLHLLDKWLRHLGMLVFNTEWNSSAVVKEITSKGKRKALLTPTTFSLLPLLRAGLDYYESGVDLGLSDDLYDSFIIYQRMMVKEFRLMEEKYGLAPIDANRPIGQVNADLQGRIDGYLHGKA